jgi:uncharacterized protein (TIGR02594 family)
MKAIELALSQVGIKEIVGRKHNPEVLKYFKETGQSWVTTDEMAWCSAFANWICKKSGLPYTGKLNARSWLKVGRKVDMPKLGDIVVFWRESPQSWKGHVAFFIRETKNWIYVLGGNQNNQVKISAYPKYRLLQYRRLD